MDNKISKQYYLKTKEYFSKEYWGNNDENDLFKPNGFKEYPIFVYTALCQQIDKDGKVLDLGCGNGLMLKHLMQYSGYQLTPYGIEFLKKSIKQAKKIIHPEYKDNFLVGNIINYPFDKGPFDFIFITPHHIYVLDRKKFLKKLKKNCTPNGKIIFYAHSDVLRVHKYNWVGDFPEIKNWKLIRKDSSQLSIAVWKKH